MKTKQLSGVITLSSLILYSSLALDVCRDIDNTNNCQSCGDTVYPRDEFYRENCMKSCDVCKGILVLLY
ncbi:hypothetical protein SNE40_012491 [Patella caerulea]|uniref:Uncharacterized protein n=1 Tax=Patella caerulea TaxID=87958 RepID=A0AAN8JRD6_PATCE